MSPATNWTRALKVALPDAAIILLLLIAYIPLFHAGFIWDDDVHLTENPHIVGPLGFRGIWTSGAATYYPLVLTSFWLQHALWGLNPFPYHLVNVLMHGLCAIFLRRVLLSLNLNRTAAWLGAVLWALHPVQVETAAWITELKNTQSCLFYLLSILGFIKWRNLPASETRSRVAFYMWFFFCAVLAVLSKTSTVMLPVILGLCAWWLDGRWTWRTLKGLMPFFAVSTAAAGWTIWEQKFHSGALGADWSQNFLERVAVAGNIVWFYLGKLIWPQPLIFLYPRWEVDAHRVLSFAPALAVVAALFALWWFREGWARPLFFAFACFVVSLFPVLNFFNVYFFRYSFVGDHFQYLASIAPLALAGAGLARALQNRRSLLLISGAIVVSLSVLTAQHARAFVDNETLWRDTIRKKPDAWLAHNNLATIFLERENTAAAIVELEVTLRLQPHYAEGHANLANVLLESGRFDEAATHFQLALEGEPDYGRIHDYLGVSLMMSGRLDEAIEHIRRAIEIDPLDSTARENLGLALGRQGKMAEALAQFKEAVRVNPNGIKPLMRYGTALFSLEQYAEARAQFVEVLRVSPDFAPAHKFLGMTLFELHQTSEALSHLQEALRLEPGDLETRKKLDEIRASLPH